jgi:hypothetical protein
MLNTVFLFPYHFQYCDLFGHLGGVFKKWTVIGCETIRLCCRDLELDCGTHLPSNSGSAIVKLALRPMAQQHSLDMIIFPNSF